MRDPVQESLIAASGAWQELGASLEESAENYVGAVSSLTGSWHGPSSSAMVEAVPARYHLAAHHRATDSAAQFLAQAAATAFTSVRAAVVPLADVIANRTQLLQLLATNEFGNKLPAIAENEQEYQEMWANNSAAMVRYQAASAQATTLPQFSSPPSITNPAAADGANYCGAGAGELDSGLHGPNQGTCLDLLQQLSGDLSFFDNSNDALGPNANLYNTIFSSGFPINLLSYLAQNQSAQALTNVQSQIGQGLTEGESALGPLGAGTGRTGCRPGCAGRGFGCARDRCVRRNFRRLRRRRWVRDGRWEN